MKNETKITEISFEDAEYCVFDFETTGTSARTDKVIEIGIVKIKKGKIADTFQSYINPGRSVPYYITQITGITNFDVQDAPYFEEVYHRIKEFIGEAILVAHNLNFDYSFLRYECLGADLPLADNSALCTLRLARRLYPSLPSRSLGNLAKHLRIQHRNIHRGLGDATATAKILIKMFNALREDHNIDTVSDLIHFQSMPSGKAFKIIKKRLVQDFANVPDAPGIYFFKNAAGDTVYIGKAKSLKQRISNYFQSNTPRKTREIVRKAHGLGFQVTNSELTALLAEAELIKKYNPKLNTLLKRYSRNYFIRMSSTHQFPAVDVVSTFQFDGNDYFGPYPNRDTANSLKEIIDKTFQLRECSDKELSRTKKCYLSDIERCFAPCIYDSSKELYGEELVRVSEFLCGYNQSALDRLLNKMKELSNRQKFEEAAHIRDVVNSILQQLNKASILAEPVNKANVLIEISGSKENDYLILLEGKIYIRDFFADEENNIEEILDNYFSGTIQLFKELNERDLERLKITLIWLIKNKTKIKIHYLKDYISVDELAVDLSFIKKPAKNYYEVE